MESTVADNILVVGRSKKETEARIDHDSKVANLLRCARNKNLKSSEANIILLTNELNTSDLVCHSSE